MDKEAPTKSPYDQSLDDAVTAATGKADVATSTGGFYHGHNSTRIDSAKNLNNLENNAASASQLNSEQSASTIEKTANTASDIINNVAGKTGPAPVKIAAKGASRLKKYGPIGAFLGLVLLAGGFFLAGQSFMPFGIASQLTEEWNSIVVGNEERAKVIIHKNLKEGTITRKQKSAFKKQGIAVKKKVNGTMYFEFVDSSGTKLRIAADADDAKKVGKNTITWDELNNVLDSNSRELAQAKAEFKTKYDVASKPWRGQSAGWYDSIASKYMKLWGINRDRYHSFDNTKNTTEEDFKAATENKNTVSDSGSKGTKTEQDENGKSTTTTEQNGEGINSKDPDKVKSTLGDAARNAANRKANALGAAGMAANMPCIYFAAAGAIKGAVYAYQISEMLNIASAFLEATQKTQVGYGDASPMTYFTNALTQPDSDGNTAMSAAAMAILFGGAVGSQYNHDEKLMLTNAEALTADIGGYSGSDFQKCTAARAGAAIANIISDAISIAVSGGAIKVITYIGGTIATNLVAQEVISMIMEQIVPRAAAAILANVVTDMYGPNLGNFIIVGAEYYISNNHRMSGGSLGTKSRVLAFRQEQDKLIAQQAELERATRSPFDITSQYTFLGSLYHSLMPLTASAGSSTIGHAVTQIGSIVSNSTTQLLPSASALATTRMNLSEGNCPDINSIDAVCDAAGVPFIITDTSQITKDSQDVVDQLCDQIEGCQLGTTKYTQKLTPKSGTDLAKYATYCGERVSIFGTADAGIAAEISGAASNSAAGSGIPFISDIAEIINATIEANNIQWITGSACVAGNSHFNPLFQLFLTDQRVLENLGVDDLDEPDDEDTEVTYVELDTTPLENDGIIAYNRDEDLTNVAVINYYTGEEYDMSREAQFARATGMTKDQAIAWLDTMDYYTEIADYDPTDLGPINNTKEDAPALAGASEEVGLSDGYIHIAFVANQPWNRPESLPLRDRAIAIA